MTDEAHDTEAIGWDWTRRGVVDAGAAAIAGLVLGAISLLFLAGSQFVLVAYSLHGSYDPRDPLKVASIVQMAIAALALAFARNGQRRSQRAWQQSVAGAGVAVALVSTLVSASAAVFVLTR